jgi:hypothetical protein
MTYCCRYRFILLTPLTIDKGKPVGLAIRGFPSVTFEMGEEAHPAGQWAIAKIGGFATEKEAHRVGKRLGDILLVSGAVTRLGIDVGFSRPSTIQFGEAARAAVRKETGEELQGETHGLVVYDEEHPVGFIGVQARGSVLISADDFEKRLGDWAEPSSGLTERQRVSAALINDSLFVPQTEARFILRISAVEALCDQTVRDARYQTAIEHLAQQLASQTLDEEIRETLKRTLDNAKRESLRQAYMTKFRALRSQAEATAFDELYGKRSKLVHDGLGRGELGDAANAALQLAIDLLEAELRQLHPAGAAG